MSKYGFNENEVVQTKVTLIDKDGFYKEGSADNLVPSGSDVKWTVFYQGYSGKDSSDMFGFLYVNNQMRPVSESQDYFWFFTESDKANGYDLVEDGTEYDIVYDQNEELARVKDIYVPETENYAFVISGSNFPESCLENCWYEDSSVPSDNSMIGPSIYTFSGFCSQTSRATTYPEKIYAVVMTIIEKNLETGLFTKVKCHKYELDTSEIILEND